MCTFVCVCVYVFCLFHRSCFLGQNDHMQRKKKKELCLQFFFMMLFLLFFFFFFFGISSFSITFSASSLSESV